MWQELTVFHPLRFLMNSIATIATTIITAPITAYKTVSSVFVVVCGPVVGGGVVDVFGVGFSFALGVGVGVAFAFGS